MTFRPLPRRRAVLALALLSALHAPAFAADADADARDPKQLDAVSVIGQGSARQVHRISVQETALQPPGASPLQVLAAKPGVHFVAADPFGNYEWSTRFSLRGFNQARLGFTLDGIPLGDMSYGNNNGMHISRAIIAENLAGAELAEGIGALGTASSSDLGGTVQFLSADPSPDFGATVAQSLGSDAARRTFLRLDTGNHQGFSMYLSYVYADVDKWKGDGRQQQQQFNAKAVYELGEDSRIGAWLGTSDRDEQDYQDLSLALTRRNGWDWDNFRPDWARAVKVAQQYQTTGVVNDGNVQSVDDAYYDARGLRRDTLASVFGDFALGDGLRLKATAYHHKNRGQGHWFTPYVVSFPGTPQQTPISIRTTEYGIDRSGVVASLGWELGMHRIEGGLWYEDSDHNVQRNFYYITGPLNDGYFLRNPNLRQFYLHFRTTTRMLYLQDSLSLLEGRLRLDAGFKALDVQTDGRPMPGTLTYGTPGSYATGTLTAKKNFLPQLGASLDLGDGFEAFGSYAKNIAAFQPGISSPLATTQVAFDTFARNLKPEESRTFEGGLRQVNPLFEASLALYHVKFSNRLLVISQCAGIIGCANAYANVGSVTSKGAELAVNFKLAPDLRWNNSLALNQARYDNDYVRGLDGSGRPIVVATRGKTVVDSPKQLFSSNLYWTPGPWQLGLSAHYTGQRYYTYLNDAGVPSFWLLNGLVGYDFGKVGPTQGVKLALNVTNLANKRYFSTIGSNGFVVSDPDGSYQTLLAGAPRAFLLTATVRF
ncbi:TonB-dependent receptor [Thermomonas flagellata]|uniref:TonB-dependent receptor n=1 Tax=Thermomonas flagellata TaxID=2888524 RepID=UPI001F03D378|nr:TonB-dependent receptor [Thermomonas flagellata]